MKNKQKTTDVSSVNFVWLVKLRPGESGARELDIC